MGYKDKWPVTWVGPHRADFWAQLDGDFAVEALSDLSALPGGHELTALLGGSSLDELVAPGHFWRTEKLECGAEVRFGAAQWAMEAGLAPGQPFKLWTYVRFYVSHSLDGDEWDCEAQCEVDEVSPAEPGAAADFWAGWLAQYRDAKLRTQSEWEFAERVVRSRSDLLYVARDWFWSSHYDECSPPDSVRLSLRSAAVPTRDDGSLAVCCGRCLASVEGRDVGEAAARLAAEVAEKLPQFTGVDLARLPESEHWYSREARSVPAPGWPGVGA